MPYFLSSSYLFPFSKGTVVLIRGKFIFDEQLTGNLFCPILVESIIRKTTIFLVHSFEFFFQKLISLDSCRHSKVPILTLMFRILSSTTFQYIISLEIRIARLLRHKSYFKFVTKKNGNMLLLKFD